VKLKVPFAVVAVMDAMVTLPLPIVLWACQPCPLASVIKAFVGWPTGPIWNVPGPAMNPTATAIVTLPSVPANTRNPLP
jgi:hypothetical protein